MAGGLIGFAGTAGGIGGEIASQDATGTGAILGAGLGGWAGAAAGAKAGATIGGLIGGPPGAAVFGATGALIGGFYGSFTGNYVGVAVENQIRQDLGLPAARCFVGTTHILMCRGQSKPISAIKIGDYIAAFDPSCTDGRAGLTPAKVSRLYQNITHEWLIVRQDTDRVAEAVSGFTELIATPGHETLDAHGRFRQLIDILTTDPRLVLADGSIIWVTYERIRYSAETAHLFEEAEATVHAVQGSAALAPEIRRGWRTYNIEVEGLHTYVAGGIRVHNDSVDDYLGFLTMMQDDRFATVAYDGISAQFGPEAAAA